MLITPSFGLEVNKSWAISLVGIGLSRGTDSQTKHHQPALRSRLSNAKKCFPFSPEFLWNFNEIQWILKKFRCFSAFLIDFDLHMGVQSLNAGLNTLQMWSSTRVVNDKTVLWCAAHDCSVVKGLKGTDFDSTQWSLFVVVLTQVRILSANAFGSRLLEFHFPIQIVPITKILKQ